MQTPESNLVKQSSHTPQKQGTRSGAQAYAAVAVAPKSVCKIWCCCCHFILAGSVECLGRGGGGGGVERVDKVLGVEQGRWV